MAHTPEPHEKLERDAQGLLTTEEFGRLVSESPWTIKALIRQGRFTPFAYGRGRGKTHLFKAEQVDEFRKIPRGISPPTVGTSYTGEQAQAVFALLETGASHRKVVIELGIHPDVVELIAQRWARIDKGLFLTPSQLTLVQDSGLDGEPIVDAATLIAACRETTQALESATSGRRCSQCKRGQKAVCEKCVVAAIDGARRAALAERATKRKGRAPKKGAPQPDAKLGND